MKNKADKDFQQFLKLIGNNIKSERVNNDITQELIAEINNIDYKYYQRIEAGNVNITIKTLYKLAKSLNINPKKLLDNDNK